MSTIVIVNGAAGCGKTTFEQFCQDELGEAYCRILSTVTLVKEVSRQLGWDGEKTPETREFLSNFKDLLGHAPWGNIPFNDIKKSIDEAEFELRQYGISTDKLLFFVDVREPEEIQRFVDELGAITLLIRNESAEARQPSNHADANVQNFNYDFTIYNTGALNYFKQQAIDFLSHLNLKR